MKSFLQSIEWMEFQRSLGREVFDVEGAKVIKHKLPFGKSYLYIPYGPEVVSYQFSGELQRLAKQENAIFIKAEPQHDDIAQELVRLGFKKSTKNIQPHKTVALDLTQSEEQLLDAMHHKTRYNIKVAERNGVQMTESLDHEAGIKIFWELMKKTTERDKFSSYSREYYYKLAKLCSLFVVYHDDTPLAAAMVLTHEGQAYYLHGASDHEHRALMAPYALHWEIAKKLQALSFKFYDLWGIDAKKWPGVTRFKLGWGGRVVEYPGAFDLAVSPPWYLIYQSIRGIIRS